MNSGLSPSLSGADADSDLHDRRLIERVAAGDREAFEAFYHRYQRKVFAYLLRLLRRPALIEEVLDDVMLAVWHGAGRFDGRSRASTWVFGIAYHKALKALTRARRSADRDGPSLDAPEAEAPVVPAGGSGPESAAQRSELRRKLASAMDCLSPAQRAVVELTFYYGYSYPEVAEIVGCPVNTVKTRMFHARRLLKERLPRLGVAGAGGGER